MKITNETEIDVPLHMSNVRECVYEQMFSKSGENQSYFLIYLNISINESDKQTWIDVNIPFDYEFKNDKIIPVYEEKLLSYELYLNDEETACELTADEQLMLVNECIKVALEDFVYGSEWVRK